MNLTVIKWRDIPTQVMIKKSRREVEKIQLDNRFMEAVDTAATIADATDADAYLTDWKNEVIEIADGDLKEPVANKAAELESAFTEEILMDYVNNSGYKP
jgi:restriction endonuclease Mrr